MPGLEDEIQDAVKRAVTHRTQDPPIQNPPQIQGSSHHRITRHLGHGIRLPGQRRFIAGALTSQHHQIDGRQFASGDPNHISRLEYLHRHHSFGVTHQEPGGLRGTFQERIDLTTGPAGGKTLHR